MLSPVTLLVVGGDEQEASLRPGLSNNTGIWISMCSMCSLIFYSHHHSYFCVLAIEINGALIPNDEPRLWKNLTRNYISYVKTFI